MRSWLIVAHSAIGRQHVKKNLPCQDVHRIEVINTERGVAVVCDGAGSAKESRIGARIVAKQSAVLFKKLVADQSGCFPPSKEEWQKASHDALLKIAAFLKKFAVRTNRDFKSLACTVIVVVYDPHGVMISHIGDGRAAVCDWQGVWHAIMQPFRGEEANQTLFITSAAWRNNLAFMGCEIVNEPIIAFTLMSDGCENHAFRLNRYDEAAGVYIQLNEPYARFFKPLTEQLLALDEQGYLPEQINLEWQDFIERGTAGLAREGDDKTMILGILKAKME